MLKMITILSQSKTFKLQAFQSNFKLSDLALSSQHQSLSSNFSNLITVLILFSQDTNCKSYISKDVQYISDKSCSYKL